MGFYDNAFRLMRECYAELDRPAGCPIRTWTDAFRPHSDIVLYEFAGGCWRHWPIQVPTRPGVPGTPREPHEITRVLVRVARCDCLTEPVHEPALAAVAQWLRDRWRSADRPGGLVSARGRPPPRVGAFSAAGHDGDHLAWLMKTCIRPEKSVRTVGEPTEADLTALLEHLDAF